jgi:hypothetical protein
VGFGHDALAQEGVTVELHGISMQSSGGTMGASTMAMAQTWDWCCW